MTDETIKHLWSTIHGYNYSARSIGIFDGQTSLHLLKDGFYDILQHDIDTVDFKNPLFVKNIDRSMFMQIIKNIQSKYAIFGMLYNQYYMTFEQLNIQKPEKTTHMVCAKYAIGKSGLGSRCYRGEIDGRFSCDTFNQALANGEPVRFNVPFIGDEYDKEENLHPSYNENIYDNNEELTEIKENMIARSWRTIHPFSKHYYDNISLRQNKLRLVEKYNIHTW
jgi:hypothetical protein